MIAGPATASSSTRRSNFRPNQRNGVNRRTKAVENETKGRSTEER